MKNPDSFLLLLKENINHSPFRYDISVIVAITKFVESFCENVWKKLISTEKCEPCLQLFLFLNW